MPVHETGTGPPAVAAIRRHSSLRTSGGMPSCVRRPQRRSPARRPGGRRTPRPRHQAPRRERAECRVPRTTTTPGDPPAPPTTPPARAGPDPARDARLHPTPRAARPPPGAERARASGECVRATIAGGRRMSRPLVRERDEPASSACAVPHPALASPVAASGRKRRVRTPVDHGSSPVRPREHEHGAADPRAARRTASTTTRRPGPQCVAGRAVGWGCVSAREVALRRTHVELLRATDLVQRVVVELAPLGDPAGQAPDREQHREHPRREAHRLVDDAGVEVDVRVELAVDEVLVLERDLLELLRDVEQVVLHAEGLEDLVARTP